MLVFGTYATGLQRYMLIMPAAVFEGFTLAVRARVRVRVRVRVRASLSRCRARSEPEPEPY